MLGFAMIPHTHGFDTQSGSFCVELFSVSLWLLWLPPTVQRHICSFKWRIRIARRCEYECVCVDDCALCQSCDELATCLGCNHTSCLDVVSERLKPLNCHSWKNVLPITCLVFCILENISHTAYMHAPYTDSRTTTFGGVLAIFL